MACVVVAVIAHLDHRRGEGGHEIRLNGGKPCGLRGRA
jgi:hypothetical protein